MPAADVWQAFLRPAAQITGGTVHALDIEPEMIDVTRRRAQRAGLTNLDLCLRDFVTDGTGLADSTADFVMLFDLLHAEHPERLLRECRRILMPSGVLGVIHWNYDPETPRGPPMGIRSKPGEIVGWTEAAGLSIVAPHVDLPPYHYGVIAQMD